MRRDHPWYPAGDDIVYHYNLLNHTRLRIETAEVYRAVLILTGCCASAMVDSQFIVANGGRVTSDDGDICRILGIAPHLWNEIKSDVLAYFIEANGHITIKDPSWVYVKCIGADARPAIPASVRSEVMRRDQFRCVYCGTTTGPFALDHVIPYSRGGALADPENLVCSCGDCNQRKKARTPEEWAGGV